MNDAVIVHLDDLVAVLDYVQPDEERDIERLDAGTSPEDHIVHAIRRLRRTADRRISGESPH